MGILARVVGPFIPFIGRKRQRSWVNGRWRDAGGPLHANLQRQAAKCCRLPKTVSEFLGDGYLIGEMQHRSDAQLLRDYAERGAESAFTELVNRHTNLVYSAAARQAGSPEVAADITQNVFIALARAARELSPRLVEEASLAGWLCRSVRNIALNLRRDDFRRHSRERQAMEQVNPDSNESPDWEHLRPVLDEAMAELSEPDYDALIMRFFNNQDLRSVGQALGVTDDAAQKRVARALDRLRAQLSRRGIRATATALAMVLSAQAVQAAPAGLAAAIATATALGQATFAGTATLTKTIAMTTLQKTLAALTITVASTVTLWVIEHQARIQLRDENQSLRRQVEQVALLTAENERLSNQVARAPQVAPLPDAPYRELLRLRGEVGLLRQQNQGLASLLSEKQQAISTPEFQPSSAWSDSGNSTPEAAADTFAWAMKSGNADKLSEVLWKPDSGDTNTAVVIDALSKGLQTVMSEIEASRLILTDQTSPDQVTFWYQSRFKDGRTLVSPLTLLRAGDTWKVKLVQADH